MKVKVKRKETCSIKKIKYGNPLIQISLPNVLIIDSIPDMYGYSL